MIIKIFGERNTGTNYLMRLLQNHMEILEQNGSALKIASTAPDINLKKLGELGWKHRLVCADFLQEMDVPRESIIIVTLTKNPYSWLLSLYKRPYNPIHLRAKVIAIDENGKPRPHTTRNIKIIRRVRRLGYWGRVFLSRFPQWSEYEKITFSDFIRAKWFAQFHEGHDKGFKNSIQLWNAKNAAYLELAKYYNVLSFTYEELLQSSENVVRKVFDHLGMTLGKFENMSKAAKKEDEAVKDYYFYKDYYLNERWREEFCKQDLQWVSSQLDPIVMQAFGYKVL